MTVYFDKENYISYLSNSDKSQKYIDTLRMIKNQLKVHLNFLLSDLDDDEFALHTEFEEGVSIDFKLTRDMDKVKRPLKKDSFPSNSGIYLLNDNENVPKIKSLHTILIGSINEEVEILNKIIINVDYSFHWEKNIGKEITPSTHLNLMNLPFSTLVIIDRYMFKGPDPGGNIGLYEYNIDKILRNIFNTKNGYSKVVLIYQVNVKVKIDNPSYDEGPDISKLTSKIKKVVSKHCPAPVVLFIGVPSGFIKDEHDRYILSNYIRIKSGDSLVYFDSSGETKTNSNAADFYSLGFRQYRVQNEQLVDKVNKIAEGVLNGTNLSKIIDFN